MKIRKLFLTAMLHPLLLSASIPILAQDSSINNLVLPAGYTTSGYGAMPAYIKAGQGSQTLVLIPGLGFDASVFSDFMEANKKNYTMYAITIAGYGNSKAAPMPPPGTSYGEQTWNKGVMEGLVKLIDKEQLMQPVIVGHFVQGIQIAIRFAAEHPDKTGGLILMGGPVKFIAAMNGKIYDEPLAKLVQYTDKYTAPVWFKTMKKEFFDANNFRPEIYSLDSTKGVSLWKKSAGVDLSVAIRYSCEYFASDAREELVKLKCRVLVLRALFNDKIVQAPVNNYLRPQFIDAWNDAPERNNMVHIKDIKDAACFIWKDNPAETYRMIREFLDQ